ncbi:MAG: Uma2 family endonuclease [Synechococcales bacterium]|nr:Uma2 family endonuclease [Synechococcales bacterium]
MPQLVQKTAIDRQIIQQGLTWVDFKLIQKGLENSSGLRLSYYAGIVEIFMPGKEHELFKSILGHLLELFFLAKGIEYQPTGSMTQEREGLVSLQADESYCIGAVKPIPDLAIEVIVSSGNLQKLQQYQVLEIPEVWFWEDGLLQAYHLCPQGYERVGHSEIPALAELDFDLLTGCVRQVETSTVEAARQFWQGIQ